MEFSRSCRNLNDSRMISRNVTNDEIVAVACKISDRFRNNMNLNAHSRILKGMCVFGNECFIKLQIIFINFPNYTRMRMLGIRKNKFHIRQFF